MKYVKAQTVFPRSLLIEIQKYVQGELVYIPKLPINYEKWRANTDTKRIVELRNNKIIQAFKDGAAILELVEQFHLSEDTIKKIVYRQSI